MMDSVQRITSEMYSLWNSPPDGYSCDESCRCDCDNALNLNMSGPEGTPYEGGSFKLFLQFPSEYPKVPPVLKFITPIYHMNVDKKGRICISSLNNQWRPEFSTFSILLQVRCMLSNPQMEYFLNPSIAVEYMFKKDIFDKTAREWTKQLAKPLVPCGLSRSRP